MSANTSYTNSILFVVDILCKRLFNVHVLDIHKVLRQEIMDQHANRFSGHQVCRTSPET